LPRLGCSEDGNDLFDCNTLTLNALIIWHGCHGFDAWGGRRCGCDVANNDTGFEDSSRQPTGKGLPVEAGLRSTGKD
jgi:hypothetical protein